MRIQAINTNTNFKGLFTKKSNENGGNWKMEYQPYSWEKNADGDIGYMANKERVDVYASRLPDNEEIFTRETYYAKESSKDILGTESYFLGYDDKMRRTIDEKPAMNREDSLKVLKKKYEVFLDMKKDEKNALERGLSAHKDAAETTLREYGVASSSQANGYEYGQGFMQKGEGLRRMYNAKFDMDAANAKLGRNFDDLYNHTKKYTKLTNSMLNARDYKDKIAEEIDTIKGLRESGKLIDISSRTADKPNAPLEAALNDIRASMGKFICLPHRLITFNEVLRVVNPRNIEGNCKGQFINFVEDIIRRGI